MSAPEQTAALESLLRWYAAMGVDAAIDEAPHDRFVAPPPPRPEMERPPPPLAATIPRPQLTGAASAEALIAEARARAAAADTLEALRESFAALPGLTLATTARMIFSGGTPGAKLMLIGGAPEADDERQGAAFAGAQGRLLDAMLKAIGLDREHAYLGFVVPFRPPGNRPPTSLELSLCLPFARRHIALAAPEIILCLGERAAQPLLAISDPISKLRGRWLAFEGEGATVKLIATFSPAYLMSQPLQKRRAWADLQMAMAELR